MLLRSYFISIARVFLYGGLCVLLFLGSAAYASAASLRLSPETGVYTAGATFSARVVVNTAGQPINAAEGELSFDASQLSVVSISKAGSIFTLWTREPEFSNSTGKISFGGGSPSGYTGAGGTLMTVTFRTKHAGTTNVSYAQGSVLAADGKGTNVISGMQGGSYTVQAASDTPAPEYVAPQNTPQAPAVTSSSHPDQAQWYREHTAKLSWKLPADVVGVRTALDAHASAIPTKVYETPIGNIEIPDLPEGESYFHIQLKNKDGWGRVAHYRLAVDAVAPTDFSIAPAPDNDPANPAQQFVFTLTEEGSGIDHYLIQIDNGEQIRFDDTEHTMRYATPARAPGAHAMVVEAFDKAGNSVVASTAFTVTSFEAPVFTDYPREMSAGVIPVIKGTSRPDALVHVTLHKLGATDTLYDVHANSADGGFAFIPEGSLSEGVYEISADATDAQGAQSARSETIRIAVQQSGFLRVGGMLVSILSVIVPLLGITIALVLMLWYGWHRARGLRLRIRREVTEAEHTLAHEFDDIVAHLKDAVEELKGARKGRLTKQEETLITSLTEMLAGAEKRVKKEIEDIERVVKD